LTFVARSHILLPEGNGVIYLNRRARPGTQYAAMNQNEERITLGTRWWGNEGHWDHSYEAGRQTGRIGTGSIEAWYVSADNGLTFRGAPWQPRVGLRFNIGSGDRSPNDDELNTFSPLFASTAYSGLAGLVGPSNSVAIAPSTTLRPHEDHTVTLGVVGFWRQSTQDGTYNIFSEIQRMPGTSDALACRNPVDAATCLDPDPTRHDRHGARVVRGGRLPPRNATRPQHELLHVMVGVPVLTPSTPTPRPSANARPSVRNPGAIVPAPPLHAPRHHASRTQLRTRHAVGPPSGRLPAHHHP